MVVIRRSVVTKQSIERDCRALVPRSRNDNNGREISGLKTRNAGIIPGRGGKGRSCGIRGRREKSSSGFAGKNPCSDRTRDRSRGRGAVVVEPERRRISAGRYRGGEAKCAILFSHRNQHRGEPHSHAAPVALAAVTAFAVSVAPLVIRHPPRGAVK